MLAMASGVCYTTAVWSRGQVVKTPPFHGGIMGSNPVGTTSKKDIPCECLFYSVISVSSGVGDGVVSNLKHRAARRCLARLSVERKRDASVGATKRAGRVVKGFE